MMIGRALLTAGLLATTPCVAPAADPPASKAVGGLPAARTVENVLGPVPPAPDFAAWDNFAQGIKDMWRRIYAKVPPRVRDDPQGRQEVARLMMEALTQQTLEAIAADGDHPMFLPHISMVLNVAQPNADTVYRAARITPGGSYRLRGSIGSLPIFKMAQLGLTPDQTGGGINAMGYDDFAKLHTDKDGRFDVMLSPTRPVGYDGDWWPLNPKASFLMVRQVSADWAAQHDPTIAIERTDVPVERTRPSAADLDHRLRDVPRRAFNIAAFLVDHVQGLRDDGYINKLRVFDVSNGSALVGQFYYEGAYELKPDDALIIESKMPAKCGYSSLILTNDIYETTDWYNNPSSLNGSQVHVDMDGILRIVVSAKDPGVPNWMDTAGYPSGAIQGRWTDCDSQPMPTVRKVAVANVRKLLPKETPVVTPAEREIQVRDRRALLQQRPLW
jgi:hypothetical protein